MDISIKKELKKTTSTQFEVLVKQLAENPELAGCENKDGARGAPVYGSDRMSMEELWKNIAVKVNSYGPPQRSVIQWKKIWADLKCRTKKKIAENNRSLNATGGGPFEFTPLSELEQAIDKMLLMTRAAAPSGLVLGTNRQAAPRIHCNSATNSSETLAQPAETTLIAAQHSRAATPTTTATIPTATTPTETTTIPTNRTPSRATTNIGVVTPRVTPHTARSQHTATGPRHVKKKRSFHDIIGESAKEQAKSAKLQAEACREMAASCKIQAEATKAISEALLKLVAVNRRQTEALEEFIQVTKNTN